MNKTQAGQFVESVAGTIIGESHSVGQLFYDGRSQGPRFSGDSAGIREQAIAYRDSLKTRLGAEYARLYPAGLELRIWD